MSHGVLFFFVCCRAHSPKTWEMASKVCLSSQVMSKAIFVRARIAKPQVDKPCEYSISRLCALSRTRAYGTWAARAFGTFPHELIYAFPYSIFYFRFVIRPLKEHSALFLRFVQSEWLNWQCVVSVTMRMRIPMSLLEPLCGFYPWLRYRRLVHTPQNFSFRPNRHGVQVPSERDPQPGRSFISVLLSYLCFFKCALMFKSYWWHPWGSFQK